MFEKHLCPPGAKFKSFAYMYIQWKSHSLVATTVSSLDGNYKANGS